MEVVTNNRFALCIGISAYSGDGLGELPNAVDDATHIHKTLTLRGFDSQLIINASFSEIDEALRLLAAKGTAATHSRAFTVIYFAGHGFESGGLGFLLPVDFEGPPRLVRIPSYAVSTLSIVDAISGYSGPKLIILDACRLDATIGADSHEVARFYEVAKALKEQYPDAMTTNDVIFAFATSAGSPAGDGLDGHSRYCTSLASGMLTHDRSLDELLSGVAQEVIRDSRMGQRPWYLSSLTHHLGFSDLPTFLAVPFEIYLPRSHELVTRFCQLGAARCAYGIEHKLIFSQGRERDTLADFTAEIQVVGAYQDDLYVLLASGLLMHGVVDPTGLRFSPIYQVSYNDNNALAVSPDGCMLVIAGMSGYEVISRSGTTWLPIVRCETPGFDIYNAKFVDNDSFVACGSSGIIREVSRSTLMPSEWSSVDARVESHAPVHDLEIIDEGKGIVAAYADGMVRFFDRSGLRIVKAFSLNRPSLAIAQSYSILREQLSRDEVELYLRDRQNFATQLAAGHDALENIDAQVGRQELMCCSLLEDPRILAIGATEGYIFLIDLRDRELFRTIDVGGGLGKSLRWLCADPDANAFVTLLSDGTMVRYEGLPPFY